MKAAIIGASAESLHTIKMAKKHGITVVALDGNEQAEGLEQADTAKVVNISKEKETLEVLEKEKIDFVLTVPIGRYLTTIGYVNDELQLPGIGKEAASYCTDKLLFHNKMDKHGLRNCICLEIKASRAIREELLSQIEEISKLLIENEEYKFLIEDEEKTIKFPAIMKPRFGSGSREIHFLNNLQELKKALDVTSGEDYVLEECVPGEEYGVDGAVIDGKFYLVLLRHKENTPLPARQAVAYFSVLPEDEFYKEVKVFMEKTVKALGLKECLFHADLIRTSKEPFVIELSARPSGHNLHNLFTPLCTGVDMAEEYIKCRMGKDFNFVAKETKQMMIHYFDMEGKAEWIPDRMYVENILGITFVAWKCNIREGDELGLVCDGHSLMGRGYFILEGSSEEELKKQAKEIKSLFHIK